MGGCCSSTTARAAAAAAAAAAAITTNLPHAHSSSRNITAPSTRRSSHASHAQPSIDRPNAPLKPIAPTLRAQLATGPWTPSRLAQERQDWWDTQVTGSPQIWGAIRLASQHLQAGEVLEAQTLLDVAGCTCPTGLLWRGVYDDRGVQYTVPDWVLVTPDGLVAESDGGGGRAGGGGGVVEARTDGDGDGDGEGEVVKIKVRLSQGPQQDVVVCIKSKATIETITDAIFHEAKLDPRTTRIRLVYAGHLYLASESLDAHAYWRFENHHFLTALVTQR